MLKVEKLTKVFYDETDEIHALNEVDFSFPQTGFFALVGPSGSGKSTLINVISGLEKPDSGAIIFRGHNILPEDDKWWENFRNEEVGIVFQDFWILEEKSIVDNVVLPLLIRGVSQSEAQKTALETLDLVGLREIANKKAVKLSGGQKQRLAVARAIVKSPSILLADEPTGNLDEENSRIVFSVLKEIAKKSLVIVVTHDVELCREYADNVLRFRYGTIQEVVSAHDDRKDLSKECCETDAEVRTVKELKAKPLNRNVLWSIILDSLKLHWVRYAISGLPLICFSIVLAIAWLFVQSNEAKSLTKGISKSGAEVLPVAKIIPESYRKYVAGDKVTSGEKTLEYIERSANSNQTMRFYNDVSVHLLREKGKADALQGTMDEKWTISSSKVATVFCLKDKFFESLLDCSSDVPQENQAIIGFGLATAWGITEGDLPAECFFWNKRWNVVGIQKRNFKDSSVTANEWKRVCGDEYEEQIANAIWIHETYQNNLTDSLQVSGFDAVTSRGLLEFVANWPELVRGSNGYEQLTGRLPEKNNEVVISVQLLEACNIAKDDIIGKTYGLMNLYDAKYDCAFWDKMNFYDLLGGAIKIVGVAEIQGDYLITDDLYETIEKWGAAYLSEGLAVYLGRNPGRDIECLHKSGLRVDLATLNQFYDWCETRRKVGRYLPYITLVMCLALISVMISVFSYRIVGDKRRIALYKSLGVRKKDISSLYLCESMVVTLLIWCVSIAGTVISVYYINQLFKNQYFERIDIDLISMKPTTWLLLTGIFFMLSLFAVLVPLRRLQNRSTMEIIKSV